MPGMFDTTNLDEDVRNPPPRFQVGMTGGGGRSMRQMNPKMLVQLLQAKMQQHQQAQAMAAKQAIMAQQQAQQARIIGMMTPQEQQDARMFGIKYVADARKAKQAQGALDDRATMGQDRTDARFGATAGMKSAADEAKKKLAQMLLGGVMNPVQNRAAQADSQLQGADAAAQAAATMPPMPGNPQAGFAQSAQQGQQQMQAQDQQARTLTPQEWSAISDAQKKAGVPEVVPQGFQLQEDITRQAQEAQKAKAEAQKAAEKMATEKGRSEGGSLAAQLLGPEVTEKEAHRFMTAMKDPKAKPWQVADRIIKDREAAAAKGDVKATKTDKERQRLAALASEYNAAIVAAQDNEMGQEAKPAARANVVRLRELLKSEGIEPPTGDKPVDIYQFRKGESPAAHQPSKASGGGVSKEDMIREATEELQTITDEKDKAALQKYIDGLKGGVSVAPKRDTGETEFNGDNTVMG